MTTPTQTVRETALERQTSIREFERREIDRDEVADPKRPAEECAITNPEVDEVLAVLEAGPNLSD